MKIRFLLLILGFFACALKMLPPSPDRFAPRLQEVEVINRTKINLKFNEDILTETISPDSIIIISTSNETLAVKEISLGRKGNFITLITQKQQSIRYSLAARVSDLAENRTKIAARFFGSTLEDTVPPRISGISPKLGATKQREAVRLELQFSEEIDTILPIYWLILPKNIKNRFQTRWHPDHKRLTFYLEDSLGLDTIVYFTLLCSVFDFEENRLISPGFTFFTSDSLLNTVLVTGVVSDKDKAVTDGIVIFAKTQDDKDPMALAITDSIGSFAIQIRKGIYDVLVLADTNFDNRVDLSGKSQDFDTDLKELRLEVYPDSLAEYFDWYLR